MPVGRPIENWQNALEIYLKEASRHVDSYTIKKYRWNFTKMFKALEDAGLESNPALIGDTEIRYLLDVTWAKHEASTRKWYASTLSMVLTRFGNEILKEMNLKFPQDCRTNVNWLTPQEMMDLLDFGLTPLEATIIHLELCLGLRNVETKRLRLQDIHDGYMDVRGKGVDLGKWRTVPFHPDTKNILRIWMKERNKMIAEAQKYRPNIIVPDNLIIWKSYVKKPQIGVYSEESNGLTKITINRVRERLGIDFENHTLRRTFGRSLWLSKRVQTETISKIYGHSDTRTTLDYIGVNLDDMSSAMGCLNDYQNELKDKKKGGN